MNRRIAGVAGATLVVAALGAAPVAGASVRPSVAPASEGAQAPGEAQRQRDDRPGPIALKQREARKAAVDAVVQGKATVETRPDGSRAIKVGSGDDGRAQYVRYDVQREESIFTILAEFGEKTQAPQNGTPGPLHNAIKEPDRTQDNTTLWRPDFDRKHYQQLMFGTRDSFKDFYTRQSNGRFLAKGDVSDWVRLPYNEARYGHNPAEGDGTDEAQQNTAFVADTATAWYDAQKAAGKSDAAITAYLAQFDKVDRYDYDGDGIFNEPDGYIDHFQAIHAGEGEEAGGGAQGEDAIWSHRSYANSEGAGKTGPAQNLLGGVPLGSTGLWIGDYTTEPENGGLGVFVHEFGHDLGLPDFYDTKGGANTTGFWTLMSSGSWLGNGHIDIGSEPGYMGPWEKLQLGWLDYTTVEYGKDTTVALGPASLATANLAQAVLVKTPDTTKTTTLPTPHSGSTQWWSGSRDSDKSSLQREIDLTGATSGSVSAWVSTDLETGYDYLYAQVSTDGGTTWTQVGDAIDGKTPYTQRSYDLSAYAGTKVLFRFYNSTDVGTHWLGSFIDDITVTVDGKAVLTDDVENGGNGWVAKGFTRVGASVTEPVKNYYLAENRTYQGYDQYLSRGPYNFGFLDRKPLAVEHFPYQDGLLVWFQNGLYADNNTSTHPGGGLSLPVDARPLALRFPDGTAANSRVQPFDATFGLQKTDPITLHRKTTQVLKVPAQPAIPVFDDTDPGRYYDASVPTYSTKVAGSGTKIEVVSAPHGGTTLNLKVTFATK